ncbi:MAG UNVERIFIED_CONTAM: hypothetical protein LVT10_02660 [Anaerolineae bacterium]
MTRTTAPELRFDVWHNIEEFWDYGYVMVSADDGQTWEVLSTEATTTDDPNYTAYGAGYTGEEHGFGGGIGSIYRHTWGKLSSSALNSSTTTRSTKTAWRWIKCA